MAVNNDDRLCCCEYINIDGERSHILACCCDCEALDQAVESCIRCKKLPTGQLDRILDVIIDRLRLPTTTSGAKQANLDILLPLILVPTLLYMATFSPIHTCLIFLFMPVFMLFVYRLKKRLTNSRRTNFFFTWGVVSVLFGAFVFETAIISFREVLLWENMTLGTIMGLAFYIILQCRSEPGFIRRGQDGAYNTRRPRRRDASRGDQEEIHFLDKNTNQNNSKHDSCNDIEVGEDNIIHAACPPDINKSLAWCTNCLLTRPPRSGHCTICNWCIIGRDHHCIWLNCCIGARNHRSFILAWMLIIIAGYYACQLSLTSICTPEMYFNWFLLPNDCRFIYMDFCNSIGFVVCMYTLASSHILLLGLLHQFLLIGQNVTMQEFHRAAKRGALNYGLFVSDNPHNRGFLTNFMDFWTGKRQLSYEIDAALHSV